MIREIVAVLLVAFTVISNATKVIDCVSGNLYEDPDQVQITACDSPPCRLRQKTMVDVKQRFIPDEDINSLHNSVHAYIAGIPLPFIGVDGSNACELIYNEDGTKAGCPLVKGKAYVYKNQFPVLPIYPRISTIVQWALRDGQKKDVTCFKVPAKITS